MCPGVHLYLYGSSVGAFWSPKLGTQDLFPDLRFILCNKFTLHHCCSLSIKASVVRKWRKTVYFRLSWSLPVYISQWIAYLQTALQSYCSLYCTWFDARILQSYWSIFDMMQFICKSVHTMIQVTRVRQ